MGVLFLKGSEHEAGENTGQSTLLAVVGVPSLGVPLWVGYIKILFAATVVAPLKGGPCFEVGEARMTLIVSCVHPFARLSLEPMRLDI